MSSRAGRPGLRSPVAARGFTLLEVLMALTLLALLLGLAWSSLRTAIQASRAGEALIARSEQTRTVQTFLRRQLAQSMPLTYERLEDAGEERRFEGDGERIRFVAPMPGYLSRGGAHVQTLALVDSRLEFTHAQLNGFDPLDEDPAAAEPVVLVEGIARGRFEFRDFDDAGRLGDWTDAWDNHGRLPLMVRLKLEFDRDDPRRWPAFEVTLLAASAGTQPVGVGQRAIQDITRPATGRRRNLGRP